MAGITKEQVSEFIRNNDLDWDESYPRSDWWKFRDERDAYKKQRDELINDMAETKKKQRKIVGQKILQFIYLKSSINIRRLTMKDKDYKHAWLELKEEMLFQYPIILHMTKMADGKEDESSLFQLGELLKRMDELDGTYEFQNLLSDLERGSDEKI